jgi:hypothetical protein
LLDIFWTMLIFFMWVIWLWILITMLTDVFRRHDTKIARLTRPTGTWIVFTMDAANTVTGEAPVGEPTIRVVLADDSYLVREALHHVLASRSRPTRS